MKIKTALIILICFTPFFLLLAYFLINRKEGFGASQGGAQVQLAAGRVYSEDQLAELMRYQKRAVVRDILDMTEPESKQGPYPANQLVFIK